MTLTAKQLVSRAARLGAPQPLLVRTACACARVVLPLTRDQDRGVCEHAIVTAERWTRGEATQEECKRAAWSVAARSAYASAYGLAWAAGAAYAAAYAADAAWAAHASVAWAARAAGIDASLVHEAARSILTPTVLHKLALTQAPEVVRTKVIAASQDPERDRDRLTDMESAGELHAICNAVADVLVVVDDEHERDARVRDVCAGVMRGE